MCARRVCGCALRGSSLRLAAAVLVVVALTGATSPVIEDLLNAIIIVASALTAWVMAFFAVQVYRSRRPAVRPRHASVAAAARPPQPVQPPSWMAGEREAARG